MIMVEGIVPADFDRIVSYRDALHWSRQDLIGLYGAAEGEDSLSDLEESLLHGFENGLLSRALCFVGKAQRLGRNPTPRQCRFLGVELPQQ